MSSGQKAAELVSFDGCACLNPSEFGTTYGGRYHNVYLAWACDLPEVEGFLEQREAWGSEDWASGFSKPVTGARFPASGQLGGKIHCEQEGHDETVYIFRNGEDCEFAMTSQRELWSRTYYPPGSWDGIKYQTLDLPMYSTTWQTFQDVTTHQTYGYGTSTEVSELGDGAVGPVAEGNMKDVQDEFHRHETQINATGMKAWELSLEIDTRLHVYLNVGGIPRIFMWLSTVGGLFGTLAGCYAFIFIKSNLVDRIHGCCCLV